MAARAPAPHTYHVKREDDPGVIEMELPEGALEESDHVEFYLEEVDEVNGNTLIRDGALAHRESPDNTTVQYDLNRDDTDTVGKFIYEFVVVYETGEIAGFPKSGFGTITVAETIQDDYAITTVGVGETVDISTNERVDVESPFAHDGVLNHDGIIDHD
jgi:hypothetical protein